MVDFKESLSSILFCKLAMVDAWITCGSCGHRFGAWKNTCPKCGAAGISPPSLTSTLKPKVLSFRKIIILGIVGIVAAFALLFAISSGLQSTVNHPYVNTAYGFSIDFPNGWFAKENYQLPNNGGEQQNAIIAFYDSKSSFLISARTARSGETFESVISNVKNELIGNYGKQNSLIFVEEGPATVAAKPAYYITYTSTSQNQIWKAKAVYVSTGDKFYTVYFVTQFSNYDSEVGLFDTSLASLKFNNK